MSDLRAKHLGGREGDTGARGSAGSNDGLSRGRLLRAANGFPLRREWNRIPMRRSGGGHFPLCIGLICGYVMVIGRSRSQGEVRGAPPGQNVGR